MRFFFRVLLCIVFPTVALLVSTVGCDPVDSYSDYIDEGQYDYGLSQPSGNGITAEMNVKIPMSDGETLFGDIYRPDAPGTYPVIMAEAPFPRQQKTFLGVDDNGGVATEYWNFEQANPHYWVPRGYIYISFSPRGYGGSKGKTSVLDYQEFVDYYDAIEWASAQPWSSGNVGLYGISYYAFSQYFTAGLKPPHLKAIVPWEGLVDSYRDIGYRGGIPCSFGMTFAMGMKFLATKPAKATPYISNFFDNPLMNDVWSYGADVASRPEGSTPPLLDILKDIDIPMLSVGNLNDPDLHLRGNVFAFREARSPQKKLILYTGTHWGSAFQPWANRTVLRFFDQYLKGIDQGIEDEPAIDIQLRTGPGTFTHVYGDTWPLEQTVWTKYYMDAERKSLGTEKPQTENSIEATFAKDDYGSGKQVTFLSEPLKEDVQIAGPLSAHFWVSTSKKDIDLIAELRDFDENGKETRFAYYIPGALDEPVTHGWLRASLRALDPERSLPHEPFFLYSKNEWLTPNEPVPVDVEIWPTSMVFAAGHRIGLSIYCGKHTFEGEVTSSQTLMPAIDDTEVDEKVTRSPAYQTYSPDAGKAIIYTGPDKSSWLDLPVIPAVTDPVHPITITAAEFTPATTAGQMGDRYEWTNTDEDYHSSTESSGLGLWESQLINGERSHNPETWWLKINWAGTFRYRDMVSGFEGAIEIPNRVVQSVGELSIELGVAPPPEGLGFDVQLQLNGETWRTVEEAISDTTLTLTQLSPGSYSVRSRLVRLDDMEKEQAATDWSPPTEFIVE